MAFKEIIKEGLEAEAFQSCFAARVGNGSTGNNVLICLNKIEGNVLK